MPPNLLMLYILAYANMHRVSSDVSEDTKLINPNIVLVIPLLHSDTIILQQDVAMVESFFRGSPWGS